MVLGQLAEMSINVGEDRTDQPAAELWTIWTNETCRPTNDPTATCTLGYYPVYVLSATTRADIKAGIDFAREHNLRLVVRNTGHDFLGRSTGWGALVINTHSFKEYSIIETYSGKGDYRGQAVKVGAGIQGRELLSVLHSHDPPLIAVTGECPVSKHMIIQQTDNQRSLACWT